MHKYLITVSFLLFNSIFIVGCASKTNLELNSSIFENPASGEDNNADNVDFSETVNLNCLDQDTKSLCALPISKSYQLIGLEAKLPSAMPIAPAESLKSAHWAGSLFF